MSAVLDDTVFRERISRLAAALPREVAGKVLTEEAGQYVRQVIRFLPPANRAQGETAVRRDVARAINVILATDIKNAGLRKFLTGSATLEQKRAIIAKVFPRLLGPVEDFDPARQHTSRRNARGRVPRGTIPANVLFVGEDRRRYAERVASRVGYLKSGYAPAASKLGVSLPQWITRHGEHGQGSINVDIGTPGRLQSITISNRAGKYFDHARIARDALRSRAEAIKTKTLRLVRGLAVNLGFMTANG